MKMKIIKKNRKQKEYEVKFLGLPILHYGRVPLPNGFEDYVEIFPKSFENTILSSIYKQLGEQYDLVWICRVNALGENYLLTQLYKSVLEKYKTKKFCFVVHNEIHANMLRMFVDAPIVKTNISNLVLNDVLQEKEYKYQGTVFRTHHCGVDELNELFRVKYKNGLNKHYAEVIRENSKAKEFIYSAPKFSPEAIQRVESIQGLNLENFVLLQPEAKSVLPIDEEFWKKLAVEIRAKGYDIFVNTKNGTPTDLGFSEVLTVEEVTYLASKSKAIIGLRCGILEVFSILKRPMHVLYTPHRFSDIGTDRTLEIHSMLGYPFIDKEHTFEYSYDQVSAEQIINEIVGSLK